MKFAIITDQHFGIRGDSSVMLDHHRKFYEETFFPTLEKENIDTVLDLGDTFDRRKFVNYNTLNSAKKMYFDVLRERNITLHCIVGNHSVFYKNTNEINSPKLLLSDYENIKIYDRDPVTLKFGSCEVLMVPWITSDNREVCLDAIRNNRTTILAGHFDIKGFEMARGRLSDHGFDPSFFEKYEFVWSGHYHRPSKQDNIEYLGSPYQMTWNDYMDKKGFHIFDTEKLSLRKIINPVEIFHKIIYDDSDLKIEEIQNLDISPLKNTYVKVIVKNKTNPYLFEIFLDHLNTSDAADLKIVEDILDLNSLSENVDETKTKSTREILHDFVDSLDTNTDKARITKTLDFLYDEASSI